MTPDRPRERVYLVQVLAAVEVIAANKQEAKQIAPRCAASRQLIERDLLVRADELRRD